MQLDAAFRAYRTNSAADSTDSPSRPTPLRENAASDLVGLAIAPVTRTFGATPLIAPATRADFIAGPVPIGILQVFALTPAGFALGGLTGGGSMLLTYAFTPRVVPAPPGILAVVAIGLPGFRRWQAAHGTDASTSH